MERPMSEDVKDGEFAMFDTAIGTCGIVWTAFGIKAVQLPLSGEDRTRTRIRQRYGRLVEAIPPMCKPR
jgi:methylated-DNA-[protein]-cysteine S-methyltransferase